MPKISKDNVLPESNLHSDSDYELECDTCGVSFVSVKALDDHMKGKKHSKKVAQEMLISKLLQNDTTNSDDEDESDDLHCAVCDKHFSGHVSYLTHLRSAVHAKFLKKSKLKQQMADMPEVNRPEESEEDGIFQKTFARCAACKKEFSGPEPYDAHLKSSAHKKKVLVNKLSSDQDESKDESRDSEDDEAYASCKVCQKSFSGPIPYQTHLLSNVHKKNLVRAKVAEEMKGVCESHDPETGFVCKVCKKAFVDPLMFRGHLANNSHERQKAKTVLKEFLKKYPEIVFVAPFGDDAISGEEGDAGGRPRQDFYLICKLCEMSFSGPESAQAHAKSKKHLGLKEKMRVLKLIKEQQMKSGKETLKVPEEGSVQDADGHPADVEGDDFEVL